MRIGPFELSLGKRAARAPEDGRGWTTLYAGGNRYGWAEGGEVETFDFQRDVHRAHGGVAAQSTVFACTTLIASTIAMLRLRLVSYDAASGIWTERTNPAFTPVLRKPNRYQTRQQFIEDWLMSKLTRGNAYVLKVRDKRRIVSAMYVLNPSLVTIHVAESGDVYYRINADNNLVGDDMHDIDNALDIGAGVVCVPASEIIHDRWNCIFHPLVGLSPLFASGLAASQALAIQKNSAKFFKNMSRPSGILTAPGQISDATALRLKTDWEANYGADRLGRVAVLGDNLKYEAMTINAVDAELVAQLKLTSEMICSTFHVPAYMAGAAPPPAQANIEALNLEFYVRCLQCLIEGVESCLDEGLGLTEPLGTEFDLSGLLRMDMASQTKAAADLVGAGIASPNEARKRFNLPPVAGGEAPYLQMQNWSLQDLAARGEPPKDTAETPAAKEARELLERTMGAMERAANGLQRHATVSETRLSRYRTHDVDGNPKGGRGERGGGYLTRDYKTKDLTAEGGTTGGSDE